MRWKVIPFAGFILAVLLSVGYPAQAQQGSPGRQGRGSDRGMEQMTDMMFRDMDTNRDGKISKQEWEAFQDKQFDRIDKEGKGYITKDDVIADMESMRREQMRQRGPASRQ